MKTNPLNQEQLAALLAVAERPCLSLYQPTHRHHPENQQDPIRFRELVKDLRAAVHQQLSEAEARTLLDPFESLQHDNDFWNRTSDGLAVFSAPGFSRVFALQRTVQELVVVADSFHTKPLRRFLQSADRYQILGLSLHEIKLFEGNRDGLYELELAPGVPGTITDALGEELTEPHQTVASYGGTSLGGSMRHGHGGKKDEMDTDRLRFFRAVDRAVMEHHSRPSGLPLMLAALPEHHGIFRQVSQNPALMSEGLTANPDTLPLDDLRVRAWEVAEPLYQARLAGLANDFAVAKSKGAGLDDISEVAKAASAGRVARLLVEADREIAGRIHKGSGNVIHGDAAADHGDDLLDDLSELVVKLGGNVFVLPPERMPTATGAAAICRY